LLTIKQILEDQRLFGESIYQFDTDKFETTKTLLLGLQTEVTQLAETFNFRKHTKGKSGFDKSSFVYECADVIRYVAALLNSHEISAEDFSEAINIRSEFLKIRNDIEKNEWEPDQPVLVVDVDDVLADFRYDFYKFLEQKGVDTSINDNGYYNTNAILKAGLDPRTIFDDFINSGGMKSLPATLWLIDFLNEARNRGFFIQILTARPKNNPLTHYLTYTWIRENGLEVDAIDFSPEKYSWLTGQEYFQKGCVVAAIDDSPKHCIEYARHGVNVLAPLKNYNVEELNNVNLVKIYRNHDEFEEAFLNYAQNHSKSCSLY